MSEPAPSERCPFPHTAETGGDADIARCPVAGAGEPSWEPAAAERAERTAREHAAHSHLDDDRAVAMSRAVAEQRAERRGLPEISDLFVRTLGRKLGHGHPLSERNAIGDFRWTDEAEARLRDVPAFCRELTRWRVEWTAHKLGLGTTITPEVMEAKYEMWGRVSHAIQQRHDEGLPWTDEAYARFERIPEFVRGQVLEAVEGNARALGAAEVDDTVVDTVIRRWSETGDFHEGLYGFR